MYNLLLDGLPEKYDGWPIRTDFRIGIQISLCASDDDFTENEKAAIMLNLLYKEAPPDFETAMRGVVWFMACGNPQEAPNSEKDGEDSTPAFSFDYDAGWIFSAFYRIYGIDLARQDLHWFQFLQLLRDINGSALTDIMEYRTADLSKMQGAQRATYEKMKKKFALPKDYAPEEQKAIDEFMQLARKGT